MKFEVTIATIETEKVVVDAEDSDKAGIAALEKIRPVTTNDALAPDRRIVRVRRLDAKTEWRR